MLTRQVFTRTELEAIAALCIKHDVIAVCDEVYEHLVFDGARHVSLRSLPGAARGVGCCDGGSSAALTQLGFVPVS